MKKMKSTTSKAVAIFESLCCYAEPHNLSALLSHGQIVETSRSKQFFTLCILLLTFQLSTFNATAQNIGINAAGTAPDASALIDLDATDKGFLITRVDTVSIASPAFGLMTLAPSDSCLYLYNGTAWMGLGG